MLEGEGDRDQKFPRVERWTFGWPGVVGLAAAVLTIAAAFFLGFPVAGLVATVDLGSGFLGLAVFLVVVTLGCLGFSVTG
jgi:hypothetical protein